MRRKTLMTKFYRVIYTLFVWPVRAIFPVKVVNPENIPADGGCLVCANHTSMLDVLILSAGLKRQIRYMAKKEAMTVPVIGKFLSALGAYAVDRGGADVGAIKQTIAFLESGEMVGIFPQGTRHPGVNPATTPIKGGVGMITWHTKATVLPVCIATKHNRVRPFSPTKLIIGKPIPFEEFGYENGGRKEYLTASERIFSDICRLGGFDRALPEASSSDEVTE
jgi:1-acyl-sn-glycerol-3-phosphate acyltransferase